MGYVGAIAVVAAHWFMIEDPGVTYHQLFHSMQYHDENEGFDSEIWCQQLTSHVAFDDN